MSLMLTITPRDPLIARDGRPFGVGSSERMRSLDWPFPSVLAGSLRTLIGKLAGGKFGPATVEKLKGLAVAGPLPLLEGQLYFPVPADLAVRPGDGRCFAARPAEPGGGEGCDLPHGSLRPVMLPLGDEDEDFKPADVPRFFSTERLSEWLSGTPEWSFDAVQAGPKERKAAWCAEGFLPAPDTDARWHVCIDPATGAAAESLLFMTAGLDYHLRLPGGSETRLVRLAARIDDPSAFEEHLKGLAHLHPMGGERRLAYWETGNGAAAGWTCPERVKEKLARTKKVRMVLATPAVFSEGWRPGWLENAPDGLAGTIPGTSVRVRLAGASIGRWQPVSGWSLEKGRVGPKPVWRLAPAGGVYFFEVIGGEAAELAGKWLAPVCDDGQHNRDGFGLAVWGVWDSQ